MCIHDIKKLGINLKFKSKVAFIVLIYTTTTSNIMQQFLLRPMILTEQNINPTMVIMQGKIFQRCTQFLYCSVLSFGGKVNTDGCHSLTWNPFSHKRSMKYFGHRKLLCELSKLSKLNFLSSSDTRRTLMHSAQRELVSI